MKALTLFLILFFSAVFSLKSSAQVYKHAAGVRIGPSTPAIKTGFSYKYFLNQKNAVEGILSITEGIGLCGLYEIHHPLSLENLQWYYGAGAYVASSNKETFIGATGIVGIDYTFPDFPVNISIDFKPELNLIERVYVEGTVIGFSARFVIGRQSKPEL